MLTTPSIVASDYQELVLIVVGVFLLLMLLVVFIFVRRCCIARERNSASRAIPLATSFMKDKDNCIASGRDNREQQALRKRDSKISNLEVRPVSASSDLFSDLRSPLDQIKSYGSAGDDLEKPTFINNLVKETTERRRVPAGWENNRDEYAKVQNYLKGDVSWASKVNVPTPVHMPSVGAGKKSLPLCSSPEFNLIDFNISFLVFVLLAVSRINDRSNMYQQPPSVSPPRILPPPPPDVSDIILPDSSLRSNDMNHVTAPSSIDSGRDMDTLPEAIQDCVDDINSSAFYGEGTSVDQVEWPLQQQQEEELLQQCPLLSVPSGSPRLVLQTSESPVLLNTGSRNMRNRINEPSSRIENSKDYNNLSEDEATESSSLLGHHNNGPQFEQHGGPVNFKVQSMGRQGGGVHPKINSSLSSPVHHGSSESMGRNGKRNRKKEYTESAHVTQV